MSNYQINLISTLLSENSYPGRGIILGKTCDGTKAACAYFIMGRSENSRNRVFVSNDNSVDIYPFDKEKVEDSTLIIYSPVRRYKNKIIVTNGDQTDTIYNFLQSGKTFKEALETREFEPDFPNLTPRISGIMDLSERSFEYELSILKSMDEDGNQCARFFYEYKGENGLGHFIHTYENDGNPLPTFTGEPHRVSIPDDIDEFTYQIWNSLHEENKISLYTSFTDLKTGEKISRILNKRK